MRRNSGNWTAVLAACHCGSDNLQLSASAGELVEIYPPLLETDEIKIAVKKSFYLQNKSFFLIIDGVFFLSTARKQHRLPVRICNMTNTKVSKLRG